MKRLTKKCPVCNKEFFVARFSQMSWRHYCSYKCRGIAQKEEKGERNRNWRGGKSKRNCVVCGKEILSRFAPSQENKKTCSTECRHKYQSEVLQKENNPSWLGGISREPYSFDFDEELKELIRKRDNYKCQMCGCPQEECIRKLAIHHIDYDKNNSDPKNLISLCGKCHTKTSIFNRNYWEKKLNVKNDYTQS